MKTIKDFFKREEKSPIEELPKIGMTEKQITERYLTSLKEGAIFSLFLCEEGKFDEAKRYYRGLLLPGLNKIDHSIIIKHNLSSKMDFILYHVEKGLEVLKDEQSTISITPSGELINHSQAYLDNKISNVKVIKEFYNQNEN